MPSSRRLARDASFGFAQAARGQSLTATLSLVVRCRASEAYRHDARRCEV
jgi:hypothetical protein